MRISRTHDHAATPPPRTWSPPALRARLNAERMLEQMPCRSHGFAADARERIREIVAQVDAGELAPDAASAQLRALTTQLRRHRSVADAQRHPRPWELLAARTRHA